MSVHREGEPSELKNQLVFADWNFDFRIPSGQFFVASESDDALWSYKEFTILGTRVNALV